MNSSKFEIKVDPKANRDIKKLQYAILPLPNESLNLSTPYHPTPIQVNISKVKNKVAIHYEVEITALSTKYTLPKK